MSSRLFIAISQSFISFYLQYTISLPPDYVAVIPLVMYISGFFVSIVLRFATKRYGYKICFALSCLIELGGCLWIWFGCNMSTAKYEIYPVAILMGAGGSAMLITSLAIVASLIGSNLEGSGFVYGAMSFVDKVSCGIALMLLIDNMPLDCHSDSGRPDYIRHAIVFGCGSSSIFGLLLIAILYPMKIGQR
jgi:Na+/melibiose symporter-like transporter